MSKVTQLVQDKQTVTPDGEVILNLPEGMYYRPQVARVDPRGDLMELFNPAWGLDDTPLVYAYAVVAQPKAIRGWVLHKLQDDRIFVVSGTMLWAFYDDRPGSKTYKLMTSFTVSERNRALFRIPRGVYHANMNVGTETAVFVNMPTRAYDHTNPDKYRLPMENDIIPFKFPK